MRPFLSIGGRKRIKVVCSIGEVETGRPGETDRVRGPGRDGGQIAGGEEE